MGQTGRKNKVRQLEHTPLEGLNLLKRLLLLLGPLLQLGDLHLLAELLEVAQLAGLGGGLLFVGLLDELLADLLDVLVALDHLGEVLYPSPVRSHVSH